MIEIISRSQSYSLTKERRRHRLSSPSLAGARYDLVYLSHIAQQQQRMDDNNRTIVCVAVFFIYFLLSSSVGVRDAIPIGRSARVASQQQTISSCFRLRESPCTCILLQFITGNSFVRLSAIHCRFSIFSSLCVFFLFPNLPPKLIA